MNNYILLFKIVKIVPVVKHPEIETKMSINLELLSMN